MGELTMLMISVRVFVMMACDGTHHMPSTLYMLPQQVKKFVDVSVYGQNLMHCSRSARYLGFSTSSTELYAFILNRVSRKMVPHCKNVYYYHK